MARRVFLHVGLPKTGTTYLQSIAWAGKDALRRQGVLLPGFGPRQHLWASCVVREEPRLERRHEDAGVGCVRLGLATGDRLTVKGLVDLDLAELTAGWRDALPEALGHGTTQG